MHAPMRGLSTPRFEDESAKLIVNNVYFIFMYVYFCYMFLCISYAENIPRKI